MQLENKNVVVIGGSRGLGRVIAQTAQQEGARVLVVARGEDSLAEVERDLPGVQTLTADATREETPGKVFRALRPDVLVVCGGAMPPLSPIHEQTWEEFSRNWDSDVRSSFLFCQAALKLPLAPGAVIILISSGAAVAGSAISGGYAGSKRTQMFMADYCQSESERADLGLRFVAIAPGRIMAETELGKAAIAGYAARLGISEADFIQSMGFPPTLQQVADALVEAATTPGAKSGNVFLVSGKGVEPF
ncbi:short-chain dehydrogenase [Capsulimonas corticalis]|uniref:Short-chain dehydrogenase n=1 Tax=Capsulimonas corticalis TaxID=2219043 RepID=A0A402D0F6_9BACT|nr:SDR family oxidoreductase [Capsulimonas corticalis]BDI33643.1 short-chain dehydrogenase [Capsulimonas corticalis]